MDGLLPGWIQNKECKSSTTPNTVDTDLVDNKGDTITFVYGQPDHSKRKDGWNMLRQLSTSHPNGLCVGDFNQTILDNWKFPFNKGNIIGAEKLPDLISELEPPNQGLEIYMDKQERWRGFCHEKVG